MLNKPRLLTPGPTPVPETVRLALARDMIHHRKKDFQSIMHGVQEKLQTLFGTKQPVLPLSCSGTGAMTAAIYSLFSPGETVLVVNAGKFGERWEEIAKSRGLETVVLEVPWGQAATPGQVQAELDRNPKIKGLCMQICETSTCVLQPVRAIAEITAKRDVLLVADGISAVGISPCPMDEWRIDCLLTGSQKGLMLPPGLALLALSERAWQKAESIPAGCFYFDLPKERANLKKDQTRFTTPVNLIVGLDASLSLLLENGLDFVYKRQWALTMLARHGAQAMGLSMLAAENFAWGVTGIKLPGGISGTEVLKIAQEKYGVCMAGGQDRLKDKIIRLGHMGWVDWSDCLAGLYAINRGLAESGGYSASRDYMEVAMAAYNEALLLEPGMHPAKCHARA